MPCGVLTKQITQLQKSLNALRPHIDLPGISDAYKQLEALQGSLTKQVGFKYPRSVLQILKLIGLSPGHISVWHDVESGWMIKAVERPGAPAVYKYVSDDVAIKILKGELTHELEAELMKPDDYIGE